MSPPTAIASRLKRAAGLALHLVDDLVDFASLQANSLTLQIKDASVVSLLKETIDFCKRSGTPHHTTYGVIRERAYPLSGAVSVHEQAKDAENHAFRK